MAVETPCQTDGAVFGVTIDPRRIAVEVELPWDLDLTDEQERLLIANAHNAMELVLAAIWPRAQLDPEGPTT